MLRVIIESPYRGTTGMSAFFQDDPNTQSAARFRNVTYAKKCLRDSIDRGECPIAGHLLYTQVLEDSVESDREIGMACHLEWIKHVDLMAVYFDNGISDGMKAAVELAIAYGVPIEYRSFSK